MLELTDENFEKITNEGQKPILIDFFAEWCPPCKMLSPILEKLEKEYEERAVFVKVNVDSSPIVARKFGINPIPMVILLKQGKQLDSFIGLRSEEEIKNWLENLLK